MTETPVDSFEPVALSEGSGAVWRVRRAVLCVLLAAVAFNTDAGRIVPDTKLDLAISPWAFLTRALHLWDRTGYAGQMQNQAYGYLFPMGPFFGIGHSLGLPAWVVQRLWWTLILVVAFFGLIRLAERMGIGSPLSVTVGAAGFALSPHVVSVLGPISVEALPMALAPWALAAVVRPNSPARGAVYSAIAIACMGCVNAAAVVASVVPTALFLGSRRMTRAHIRLCVYWVIAVALVCAWWLVPLLLLGRYSPPFLDYIENSAITTSITSLVETLRGTEDWRGFLPTSGWHAASLLLSQPALVLISTLVACLGLAGLASRAMPYRRYLVLSLLVGVVLISSGYDTEIAGAFHGDVRSLLDGPLAALRNVHKFDVLVRLPIALGIAHAVDRIEWGRLPIERKVTRLMSIAMVVIALVAGAAPFAALRAGAVGSFVEIPKYWNQAADWLNRNAADTRTLVLPGGRYGYYAWGKPKDEPLQALAKVPWEVRDAIPMVPPEHIRMLDTVEQLLDNGTPSPGLASYLRRNGIGFVLVRNDLDYAAAGAPTPSAVHSALLGSPGLKRVSAFGPRTGSETFGPASIDYGRQMSFPAIEIFAVGGEQAKTAKHGVHLTPVTTMLSVVGDQDSLLDLDSYGVSGDAQFVRPGHGVLPGSEVVVTDGNRRRETTFGRNDWASSATLTADAAMTIRKNQRDYLSFDDPRYETVAAYGGVRGIYATSSAADAGALVATTPGQQPYAAVDGYLDTAWTTAPVTEPTNQFLQVNLDGRTQIDPLTIRFTPGSRVDTVDVWTDGGHHSAKVASDGGVMLDAPLGTSSFIRVTITAMAPGTSQFQQVGIAEITSPALHVTRTLRVPDVLREGTQVSQYVFSAAQNGRAGCDLVDGRPLCVPDRIAPGEDAAGIDRVFVAPSAGDYDTRVTLVPRPGPALDALITANLDLPVSVSASSRAVPDPLTAATAVLDGDLSTGWLADRQDPDPALTFTFARSTLVSSLQVLTDPSLAASRPALVSITAKGAPPQTVPVEADGTVRFTPVRASKLRLSFINRDLRAVFDTSSGVPALLGIGVSEVRVNGLIADAGARERADRTPVQLPCGAGPTLTIDGTAVRTAVSTTIGALQRLEPINASVCGGSTTTLASGSHKLRVATNARFRPLSVRLVSTRAGGASRAAPTTRSWLSTSATVTVPASPISSVLVVPENRNEGWRATLGGRQLRRVDVSGWQQGYVIPARASGTVTLTYSPDRVYRIALAVGAWLLVDVFLTFIAMWWHRRRDDVGEPASYRPFWSPWTMVMAGVVPAVAVGGAIGAVVYGTIAALVLALGITTVRAAWLSTSLVVGGLACAAAVLAARPWGTPQYAAGSNTVQLLCLVSLAALTVSTVLRPSTVRGRHASPAPDGEGSSPDVPAGDN